MTAPDTLRGELTDRLRNLNPWKDMDWPEVARQAAETIDSLRRQVDALTKERDAAADAASVYSEFWESHSGNFDAAGNYIPHSQTDGDIRALKATLAAERETHRAEVERLKAALGPFAVFANICDDPKEPEYEKFIFRSKDGPALTFGHFRRAREALSDQSAPRAETKTLHHPLTGKDVYVSTRTGQIVAPPETAAEAYERAAKHVDGHSSSVFAGDSFDGEEVNLMFRTYRTNLAAAIRKLGEGR